jgi:hypothetical protein
MLPFRQLLRFTLNLLRELSDESAYRRHLTTGELTHSREEWRNFHTRRLAAKYSRAKCC